LLVCQNFLQEVLKFNWFLLADRFAEFNQLLLASRLAFN
jgi:hypothetical protein